MSLNTETMATESTYSSDTETTECGSILCLINGLYMLIL